jgi:hypothetical protein
VIHPAAPTTSGLRRVLNYDSGEMPQLVLYWQEMPTVGGH